MDVNGYPLVSIITPVYNGSEYLEDLIKSVLNQDYPNIEHLIIDDGSQDGGAIISILRKYPHLRWQSRAHRGQYATMNDGLLNAQGTIVCFVSADDIVSPGAVKTAVNALRKNDSLDAIFGTTSYIDSEGNSYPYPVPFQRAPISQVIYFAHIPHCSFYIKKSSVLAHKLLFNPSYRSVGDYEWMIRISRSKLRVCMIRQELSRVRIHPNQTTQKHLDRSIHERQLVLDAYKVNKFYYKFLSGLYLFEFRIWKLALVFRSNGLKGIFELAKKWYRLRLEQ